MTSMTQYQLDDKRLADGVRIYMTDSNGIQTDDWIAVRSMHHDKFKVALEKAKQTAANNPDSDLAVLTMDAQTRLIAGWSFDEKCSIKNVRLFLKAAPHIAEKIDRVAADNKRFFSSAVMSSSDGLTKNLNSQKNQKAANERHGSTSKPSKKPQAESQQSLNRTVN